MIQATIDVTQPGSTIWYLVSYRLDGKIWSIDAEATNEGLVKQQVKKQLAILHRGEDVTFRYGPKCQPREGVMI